MDSELMKKRDDELIRKYVEWDERLKYEMFQIAGVDVNPSSPKQVSEFLFDSWKLPWRQGTGEEELTALLNLQRGVSNIQIKERAIESVLERRRVKKDTIDVSYGYTRLRWQDANYLFHVS